MNAEHTARRLTLSVLALLTPIALAGCSDPVEVRQGLYGDVVLSIAGWSERDFVVDVRDLEHRSAQAASVKAPKAIRADWINDRHVEIFVVGGRVTDCNPTPLGFRVSLHQSDMEELRGSGLPDGGPTARRFRAIPDTCRE